MDSDRFRTMINVLGDSIGAGLVYELSKKELEQMNINANGDVDRPSNEICMDAVESSKMWEQQEVVGNPYSQLDVNYCTSASAPLSPPTCHNHAATYITPTHTTTKTIRTADSTHTREKSDSKTSRHETLL